MKTKDLKELQRRNSKFRSQLKRKATKAELLLKDWFEDNKIRAIFQKGFLIPFHRIVDFYIPKYALIIEVDGGYHKSIEKKDKVKDLLWLKERGMRTLRLTNEQIYSSNFPLKIFSYINFNGDD